MPKYQQRAITRQVLTGTVVGNRIRWLVLSVTRVTDISSTPLARSHDHVHHLNNNTTATHQQQHRQDYHHQRLPHNSTINNISRTINVGALISRIGFWGLLIIIIIVQYTPNPILIIKAPILPFSRHLPGVLIYCLSSS